MSILGGRKHSCIHPKAKKSPTLDEDCKRMHAEGSCKHEHKAFLVKSKLPSVWDIEDLVSASKQVSRLVSE